MELLNPKELLLAAKLKKYGFVNPIITIQESKKTGCPLPLLLAVLDQESARGHMVFGHDRDSHGNYIFPAKDGVVPVTKELYRAYLVHRGPTGHGGMQGVGPMQLTWYTFQNKADFYALQDGYEKNDGCCRPRYNIRVGAEILKSNLYKGVFETLILYNGSRAYANIVMPKYHYWNTVING